MRCLDDVALVTAITAGRSDALAEAYERHHRQAWALAHRLCGEQADDVVQEVFLLLWQQPESFDDARGSLRTYLMTITHNRAVDLIRSLSSRRNREVVVTSAQQRLDGSSGSVALLDQDLQETWSLLATLPAAQRGPIVLAYHYGYTYREVAEILGQPLGTVRSHIRRGLLGLHALMRQTEQRSG